MYIHPAVAALDAKAAWDAEHAEPSIEALIVEIEAGGWEFDGLVRDDDCTAWGATAVKFWESNFPEDPGSDQIVRSGPTLRAALLALRDAVKGEGRG